MEFVHRENEWVVNMENLVREEGAGDAVEEEKQWLKQSIYRVPAHIRNTSATLSYGPQLVSLGPFHHGSSDLAAMEVHKQRALLHLLRRTERPFRGLVASLAEVEQKLQEAYKDLDAKWRDGSEDSFLKMLLLDGCFLLEVMWTTKAAAAVQQEEQVQEQEQEQEQEEVGDQEQEQEEVVGDEELCDYAANDPVFSRHGELYVFPYVRRDMLMIENQLPLLVLQRLVAFLHGESAAADDAINNMVLDFVKMTPNPQVISGGGLALHPLDVCHRSLLHGPPRPLRTRSSQEEFVPSATELDQAGVQFMPSRTRSLHDIHFRRGVLYIPTFAVDDSTEHKLLSLMAFEQLHADRHANEVTAYVFFMDNVIKSAADARLLSASGVVWNGLGSDKGVAKMFNRLANEAVLDHRSRLHDVHRAVNAYRETRWHEWRASLIQNHAGNPWAIISLVAAVFLLILTVVQTVYTVLPYYEQQQQSVAGAGVGLLQEL